MFLRDHYLYILLIVRGKMHIFVFLICEYSFFADGGVVPFSDCIGSKLHPQRRNTSQVECLRKLGLIMI